ncbi:hypothetical protein CANARDRAFT_7237 [[Candida] arabinofermentans NRRL YB-2248]|uniref:BOD1/SHG1 domain-containing protein n=1 Tax=[Candida] arabinofermentans NRRL YB-2248 TaxID=983967 RepID=A0A1E4T2B2_9ASCO|nr:hypothetical protein CANARDRAFT_7237 [[Candida] arabinofermentans NRRL YB-2248]
MNGTVEQTPQELITKYKRKGYFDTKRKQLISNFTTSETENDVSMNFKLDELIDKLIDLKVRQDPSILAKNKGKLAALVQTALINEQFKTQRVKSNQNNNTTKSNTSYYDQSDLRYSGRNNDSSEEQEIISEINQLLNKYVVAAVDENVEFGEGLVSDLNVLNKDENTKTTTTTTTN